MALRARSDSILVAQPSPDYVGMCENLLPSCNAMHVLIYRWFSQPPVKDQKISYLTWVSS